jgi:hypothetical protein
MKNFQNNGPSGKRNSETGEKFILTPRLGDEVLKFERHYRESGGKPIIIIGDTGVGKSLFLHVYKTLYLREQEELHRQELWKGENLSDAEKTLKLLEHMKARENKIVTLNCSHYDGDTARSELFGHVKGAFTGAIKDKDGLLKDAEVVILEEVGDLTKPTQAKLLTYMEDGKFIPIGSNKLIESKARIVAATNRPHELREDFLFRFIPFFVPALHERREDVLYYLFNKFPDLVCSLTRSEVLTLVAHHWPGNVREVERVGSLLQRSSGRDHSFRLSLLDTRETLLSRHNATSLMGLFYADESRKKREREKIAEFIESQLKPHRLGFLREIRTSKKGGENVVLAFEDPPPWNTMPDPEDFGGRYGFQYMVQLPFEDIPQGLNVYCSLFFLDPKAKRNLLDVSEIEGEVVGPFGFLKIPKKEEREVSHIMKGLFEFRSGIDLQAREWPTDRREVHDLMLELTRDHPNNKFIASLGYRPFVKVKHPPKPEETDICSMTERELLAQYYKGLFEKTGGNALEAGRVAGIGKKIYSRFRKYGITPKK